MTTVNAYLTFNGNCEEAFNFYKSVFGGDWASNYKQGNNISLSLTTDSKEEADRLFNGLSKGGYVIMAMNKTFWGDYYGMWTDKFGINWMVSFNDGSQPAMS